MTEIKIVFRIPKELPDDYDPHFDLYIDGNLEKNVKRFFMDVSASDVREKGADIGLSYGIERYVDLLPDYEEQADREYEEWKKRKEA